MQLEFYGAAGEVTGSCHILTVGGRRLLLDCGLVQGGRDAGDRNRAAFPFDPARIDAVVLSHAHIDHSGRLPLLVQRGYPGRIHTHNATAALSRIMLRDSAALAESDAERENRRRQRKRMARIEPLYTVADADRCLRQFSGHRYREPFSPVPGVTVELFNAGHILGAAVVVLTLEEQGRRTRLVFSGDLGQYGAPIIRDPEPIDSADVVVMESTYGGHRHRTHDATLQELGEILAAAAGGGNVIIPAFAVGRTQELLYLLGRHYDQWQLGRWDVFLDSPMAIEASEVYWHYWQLHDEQASHYAAAHDNRMPALPNLHLSRDTETSMAINRIERGAIIIAGSGMCTGGRILHHLKHNLWRQNAHIVFIGYQAPGTLGRRLVDGHDSVRIMGETIRVGATIHTVGGLSAHGDEDSLARWYGSIAGHPPTWLVHGDPERSQALGQRLEREFGTRVSIPAPGAILAL